MGVSRVNLSNGETLIDLTSDTVTPETIAQGVKAHNASGDEITGEMPTTTVLYTEQTLTDAQKAQARENIGVGEEYRAQLVQDVLDAIGCPVFGVVDENNNIILTGTLPDATYSVKYEDEDGSTIDIGELVLGEEIVNQIPLSTDASGNPFNGGQGWKTGYRISGSTGGESAQTGTEVTGFIPAKYEDMVYIKGIVDDGTHVVGFYDSSYAKLFTLNFSMIWAGTGNTMDGSRVVLKIGYGNIVDSQASKVAFIRVSASEITNDSIITVNQEIE